MKVLLNTVLALLVCVSLVGCSFASYSKNMRAATAQATATVAMKAFLDEVVLEKYDATKVKAVEVLGEVSKFLETGKIGDLPVEEARDAVVAFMTKKGWGEYVPLVITVFDMIAMQYVPVEKLGADNIALIRLGLDSAATSANTSKVEWRRPVTRAVGGAKVLPPNRVRFYRE